MRLNKILMIASLSLLPFMSNSIDKKTKGTLLVSPTQFEFPSFPKVTMINESKKDTSIYYGNMVGQVDYEIEPGNYLVKIEPGYDEMFKTPGDTFPKYQTHITLPSNKYIELKNEKETLSQK